MAATTNNPSMIAQPPITAAVVDDGDRVLNGRIPSFVVEHRTANLPPEEREAIRWLHRHYWDEDLSLTTLGRALGYHASTLSRIMRAEYDGGRGEVVKAIEKYRADLEQRTRSKKTPFIKTALFEELRENCDLARSFAKIVCLWGESQIGKTTNLKQIASEDRDGLTLYVEIMPGAREADLITSLCQKLRLSSRQRTAELRLNIARELRKAALRGPLLLIVDEGARAGGKRIYGGGGFACLEFIRWLHDTVGFGVLFCGTNLTRDQLADADHEKYLNQFNRRCLRKVQLPDIPSRADLNAFARHYGLDPAVGDARKVEKAIIATHGLGVWLTLFPLAQERAASDRKGMTWEHVLRALAWVKGSEKADRAKLNSEAE